MSEPVPPRVRSSGHPVAVHAVAECVGSLLEDPMPRLGSVLCLVGAPFGGALLDITGAAAELLGAPRSLGVEVPGCLPGGRTAPESPSLVLVALAAPLRVVRNPPGARGGMADLSLSSPRGSPDGVGLWWVVADRGSLVPARPSAAGRLATPGELLGGADGAVVGGFVSDRPSGGVRVVLDGDEARVGSVAVRLAVDPAGTRLVAGTTPVGPAVRVTEVSGEGVRRLDGRPAGDHLRSLLAASGNPALEDARAVGLTVEGDPRLVSVRESAGHLVTSVPLGEGQEVLPSVSGPGAMRRQMAAALSPSPGSTPFVLLDRRAPLGSMHAGTGDATGAGADLGGGSGAGALVSGAIWGTTSCVEELASCALVLRLR